MRTGSRWMDCGSPPGARCRSGTDSSRRRQCCGKRPARLSSSLMSRSGRSRPARVRCSTGTRLWSGAVGLNNRSLCFCGDSPLMQNYFNYFTEIERFYQSKREVFTLLSTLDWVLIENWKEQGIPLETVLRGIDRAFSRSKRKVNSLGYCVKAVEEVVGEEKEVRIE